MQTRHNTASIDNHTQSMIKHTFYPQELCTKSTTFFAILNQAPKTQHMGHESLVLETPHCSQPRDTWSHPTKSDHGRIGPAPLTNQNRFSATNENQGFPANQVTGFRTNQIWLTINAGIWLDNMDQSENYTNNFLIG